MLKKIVYRVHNIGTPSIWTEYATEEQARNYYNEVAPYHRYISLERVVSYDTYTCAQTIEIKTGR